MTRRVQVLIACASLVLAVLLTDLLANGLVITSSQRLAEIDAFPTNGLSGVYRRISAAAVPFNVDRSWRTLYPCIREADARDSDPLVQETTLVLAGLLFSQPSVPVSSALPSQSLSKVSQEISAPAS